MRYSKVLVRGLCCLMVMVSMTIAPLKGSEIVSAAFQSPLGGLPDAWSLNEDSQNEQGVSRGIQPWGWAGGAEKALHLQRDVVGQNRANLTYTGASFADLRGFVLLQQNGSSNIAGVLLRARSVNRTSTTGYFIGIQDANTLFIAKDPRANHTNPGQVLKSAPLDGVGNSAVRLEFSAVGPKLMVRAAAWDVLLEEWVSLASIEVEDSSYQSGRLGLRASFGANRRSVRFANFQVAEIK